jgi:hypothetical protein
VAERVAAAFRKVLENLDQVETVLVQ